MGKTITYRECYTLANTFQDEVQSIWKNMHKISDNNSRKTWRQRKRAVQRKPYGKHGLRKYTK